MLRSPLASVSRQPVAAVGAVLMLGASLWLLAALGASIVQLQQGTQSWWEQFGPAIFLESSVETEEVQSLGEEIESWSQVSSVYVEPPEEVADRLKEAVGRQEFEAMKVDESMMPTVLVVEPVLWRPGEVDLAARLEAMEVRQSVIEVDTPDPEALSWLERGRKLVVGAVVVVLLGSGGAAIGVGSFLRRIQRRQRRENYLLEIFGASPKRLRRPTMVRGMVLGAVAGLMAGVAFLPWAIWLDGFAAQWAGAEAMTATDSALWSLGLVAAGWAVGTVVGWRCGRPCAEDSSEGAGPSLLEWDEGAM